MSRKPEDRRPREYVVLAKADKTLSRRHFLELVAAGTAATVASTLGCSDDGASAGPGDGGTDTDTHTDTDSDGSHLVGIARAGTVDEAVRAAVAVTSGLGFIAAGDTVLLKPNLNSGDPFPYSTNPEVVAAVVDMVRERGATRVIIADRSNPAYDTIDAMQRAGIYDVAIAKEVEIVNFADGDFELRSPAGATNWPGGFSVPALLGEVDHIINLAACKDHSGANFTMSLKAWMGLIPQNDRETAHGDLGNRLPELHLGVRESFVILDATKACLTGGPGPGGAQAEPGLIVASADPIAADVTGLAILKYHLAQQGIGNSRIDDYGVWDQPQIQRALALGIGITDRSAYDAASTGVDEIAALLAYITT